MMKPIGGWRLLVAGVALAALSAARPPARAADAPAGGWRLPPAERAAVESLGRTLLAAIAAPHDSTRRRLIALAYAPETLAGDGIERVAAQLARIAATFPGLVFDRSELAEGVYGGEVSRVLHVYARQPGATLWRDLQVRVSANAPHRLQALAFIAEVTEPVFLPNGAITDPGTLAWLNDYLDRLVAEYDLSGSALVAIGERVVFERTFGFADAARSRPVTASTHFNLASASKMFTALAVARLVADGKLSYADPIDRFFPDFPDRAHARATTVGHLLAHTSGVGEYWTPETDDALRDVRSTAGLYPFVVKAGVRFAPGTRHEYSNSNFALAGLIVERVAGASYDDFVRRLVTTPLGMSDTGPFMADEPGRALAEALTRADSGWSAVPRRGRGTAAGGWWSTARDMHRFMRGLQAGKVVSAAALDTLRVSRTAAIPGSGTDYGYGLILQRSGGTDSYGHGGTARGANAEVRYFPALEATLVVFSNQDNGAYDDLRRTLTRLITGER